MIQCRACNSFIPHQTAICPNCETKQTFSFKYLFKRATQLIMGTGFMMTLSACYGQPPINLLTDCSEETGEKQTCLGSPPECEESNESNEACSEQEACTEDTEEKEPCPSPSPSPSTSPTASPTE